MSMVSNLDLLRRVPLFSVLTPQQAEVLETAITKRRVRRGECIVEQGAKTDALYLLLNGRARVTSTDQRGREVIIATLNPGDHIGEMSLIDNQPHSATVRADVQTDLLVLGRTEFARCLPDSGSVAFAVLRGLVQRLRQADRKIESLALMDVYGRVARALIEFAADDVEGEATIRRRVSRQDLAKMVGASREMVSRVMKDLEERGFVTTREDGSMVVHEHLASMG